MKYIPKLTIILLVTFLLISPASAKNDKQKDKDGNYIDPATEIQFVNETIVYNDVFIIPLESPDKILDKSKFDWYIGKKNFWPELKNKQSLTQFHYLVSDLQTETVCEESEFGKTCWYEYVDFSDFESKNQIDSKTIKFIPEYNGYLVSYYGQIDDLDPAFELAYVNPYDTVDESDLSVSSTGVSTNQPTMYLKFDEAQETYKSIGYTKDSSLNNHYGVSRGGISSTYSASGGVRSTGAYTFDGIDDRIETYYEGISGNKARTVTAWINTEDTALMSILSYGSNSAYTLFDFCKDSENSGESLGLRIDSANRIFNATGILEGWHHVAVVVPHGATLNDIKMYMDGVELTEISSVSATASINTGTNNKVEIGYQPVLSSNYFNGTIDEVQIFDTALTQSEIQQLYGYEIATFTFNDIGIYVSNNTLTMDEGPHGYSGVPSGITHNNYAGFNNNGGYIFDGGVGDRILTDVPLDWSGGQTISAWAYPDLNGRVILANAVNGDTVGWSIYMRPDGRPELKARGDIGNSRFSTASATLPLAQWSHLVVTWNSDNYDTAPIFYINTNTYVQVKNEDGGSTYVPSTENVSIGNAATGAPASFDGTIANVRLFDKVLTQTEIQELYNTYDFKVGPDYANKFKFGESSFKSMVFYNEDPLYWNTTYRIADSTFEKTYLSDANLVSYYELEERIRDSLGANNGVGVNVLAQTTGAIGNAFDFDGADYASVTDDPTLDFSTNDFSIIAWIKTADNGPIACKKTNIGTNDAGYCLYIDGNYATVKVANGTAHGLKQSDTTVLTDDRWHHVAAVRSSGIITIYVDGVAESSYSNNYANNQNVDTAAPLRIAWDGAAAYLTGIIDEVGIYNDSLSAGEVSDIYDEQKLYYGVDISNPNLLAYYKLNEDITDFVDTNDGTASAGIVNATGISGQSYNFDASTGYITIPNSADLEPATEVTVSTWVNAQSMPTSFIAVGGLTNQTPFNEGYYIRTDDSAGESTYKLQFMINGNDCSVETSDIGYTANELNINEWYHVAGTFNDTSDEIKIYINGLLSNDGTCAETLDYTSSHDLTIGALGNSGTKEWDGQIDEFMVFDKELSAAEIHSIYRGQLSHAATTNVSLQTRVAQNYNISDADLQALWAFNADDNGTDETGTYDGTCTNCPTWNETEGVVGGGYVFDGVNDLIEIYDGSSLYSPIVTISAWVKFDDVSSFQDVIVFSNDTVTDERFRSGITDTGILIIDVRDGEFSETYTGSTSLEVDRWYHLVWQRSGYGVANAKVYINGIEDTLSSDLDTGNPTPSFNKGTIGGYQRLGGAIDLTDGYIDEIRIYSGTLTDAEILDLYNLGTTHIEWEATNDVGVLTDNTEVTTSTDGNFMQFALELNSDSAVISPFVQSYNTEEGCETDWQNDTVTAWVYDSICYANLTRVQNRTYNSYDANTCPLSTNSTITQQRIISCCLQDTDCSLGDYCLDYECVSNPTIRGSLERTGSGLGNFFDAIAIPLANLLIYLGIAMGVVGLFLAISKAIKYRL